MGAYAALVAQVTFPAVDLCFSRLFWENLLTYATSTLMNQVTTALDSILAEYRLPGASVIWYQNGHLTSANAGVICGDALYTTDSRFRIGCLVKVLTASQIMALVDDGLLDLNRPVSHYIPELTELDAGCLSEITPRQLLCHESGIIASFQYQGRRLDTANLLDALAGKSNEDLFVAEPGHHCSYSNVGYVLLALLIESLRNKSWIDDLDEKILGPLGIILHRDPSPLSNDSVPFGLCLNKEYEGPYLTYAPNAIVPADGGNLAMSATDLMKIARMHLNEGRNEAGDAVLSALSVREMQSYVASPSGPWPGLKGLAYGWLGYADGSFGFSGDGIRQHVLIRILPNEGVGLVVVANYHSAGILFGEMWKTCMSSVASRPVSKDAIPRLSAKDVSLEAGFALTFTESFRELTIRWKDGQGELELASGQENRRVEMLHLDGVHFVAPRLGTFCNLWLLSESAPGSQVDYLWNGVSMLRSA